MSVSNYSKKVPECLKNTGRVVLKKSVFSEWASMLNMGLFDMVRFSPAGYGVKNTHNSQNCTYQILKFLRLSQ